jgi:hypothetical protein
MPRILAAQEAPSHTTTATMQTRWLWSTWRHTIALHPHRSAAPKDAAGHVLDMALTTATARIRMPRIRMPHTRMPHTRMRHTRIRHTHTRHTRTTRRRHRRRRHRRRRPRLWHSDSSSMTRWLSCAWAASPSSRTNHRRPRSCRCTFPSVLSLASLPTHDASRDSQLLLEDAGSSLRLVTSGSSSDGSSSLALNRGVSSQQLSLSGRLQLGAGVSGCSAAALQPDTATTAPATSAAATFEVSPGSGGTASIVFGSASDATAPALVKLDGENMLRIVGSLDFVGGDGASHLADCS